jgi:hypothetical protein
MEDGFNLGVVEVAFKEGFEKVELVHIVGVLGALEVEKLGPGEVRRGREVIDDEYVALAEGVELMDEI